MALSAKASAKKTATSVTEGQLALDIYQTKTNIVIVAPIAGITPDDITINVVEDILTIKGKRTFNVHVAEEDYFTQECFWGDFSRSIVLPSSVDASKIEAKFNNNILTITIPKIEKMKTKIVRIKAR